MAQHIFKHSFANISFLTSTVPYSDMICIGTCGTITSTQFEACLIIASSAFNSELADNMKSLRASDTHSNANLDRTGYIFIIAEAVTPARSVIIIFEVTGNNFRHSFSAPKRRNIRLSSFGVVCVVYVVCKVCLFSVWSIVGFDSLAALRATVTQGDRSCCGFLSRVW